MAAVISGTTSGRRRRTAAISRPGRSGVFTVHVTLVTHVGLIARQRGVPVLDEQTDVGQQAQTDDLIISQGAESMEVTWACLTDGYLAIMGFRRLLRSASLCFYTHL